MFTGDFELLSFLLREPQLYKADLEKLLLQARASALWIRDLDLTAKKMSMTRGALCRLVMPFGIDTDANDQSNITENNQSVLNGSDELKRLRSEGIKVRKLLRIKLADENDLKQAEDALRIIFGEFDNN